MSESIRTNKMQLECQGAVVIPALNEAGYIEGALGSILEAVDQLEDSNLIDVYVVDNGSTDDTQAAVRDIAAGRKNVYLLNEPARGIGYGRQKGSRVALTRALKKDSSSNNPFWIISTDSDVVVPKDWLVGWFSEFASQQSGVIAGNAKFPDDLSQTNPNAIQVMEFVGSRLAIAERIFGVINTDGNHMAIERNCYSVIGPFQQPTRLGVTGRQENLAGEDWDMGTRARALGLKIPRSSASPITLSDRRFHASPREFFDGTAYEAEFLRINSTNPSADIEPAMIDQLIVIATHRQCMHNIEKPLLIDPTLLDNQEVQDFLGEHLYLEIKAWISHNPQPDIFLDRNRFILEYLSTFHEEFGLDINQRLLSHT